MDIVSVAFTLFLIMDPLGNLPVFLSVLKTVKPTRRKWVLARELSIALLILYGFLFSGEALLSFLDVKQETVSISGGIVLFIIALRMIFPGRGGVMGETPDGEPFIVPLAVPMVAGPSALATLLLLSHSFSSEMGALSLALFLAWAASAVILGFSEVFYRLLKEKGLAALERLMGMVLIMISVQMILNGVRQYLATAP